MVTHRVIEMQHRATRRVDLARNVVVSTRVLIVAHETASSAQLERAVARRTAAGPCNFALLVPAVARGLHRVVDPEDHGVAEAQQTIAVALPQLSRAARGEVRGMVGAHDPMAAVQDALNLHGFDEIIMAMSPARISRWLRMDLARKVAALGVPVSTVLATDYGDADRTAA